MEIVLLYFVLKEIGQTATSWQALAGLVHGMNSLRFRDHVVGHSVLYKYPELFPRDLHSC